MKLKQIITIIMLLSVFTQTSLMAQNKETTKTKIEEVLKGLTKASEEDLSDKQITLDGESIPVYDANGKRIKGEKFMEAMMSQKYTPDLYIDKNKDVKAVVLRIATKEELKIMQEMQFGGGHGENDLTGTNAVPFSVTDINGNTYSLDNLNGKIIVMNFWFVECKPCVMEIPELNKIVENYREKDVVFLGFALNDKSSIESVFKEKGLLL